MIEYHCKMIAEGVEYVVRLYRYEEAVADRPWRWFADIGPLLLADHLPTLAEEAKVTILNDGRLVGRLLHR